jgi:hypothetical protein
VISYHNQRATDGVAKWKGKEGDEDVAGPGGEEGFVEVGKIRKGLLQNGDKYLHEVSMKNFTGFLGSEESFWAVGRREDVCRSSTLGKGG